MTRVLLVWFMLLAGFAVSGCNPGVRCAKASDCGGGGAVCHAGFCSDPEGLVGSSDGGETRTDVDVPNGAGDGGPERDAGTWDDGRDAG